MPNVCQTLNFTADETVFAGGPLELDTWISLGATNLTGVTATLFSYDIGVIVGPEGPGPVVGPE